jgi:hypothetical protein
VAAWAKLRGEIDANLAIPIPALLVPKTNKFIFLSFIKALFELPMPKRSYNNYSYSRSFQAWKLTYRPDSTSYEGSPGSIIRISPIGLETRRSSGHRESGSCAYG